MTAYILIAVFMLTGHPDLVTRTAHPSLEACTQAAIILKKTPQPKGGYIEAQCIARKPRA